MQTFPLQQSARGEEPVVDGLFDEGAKPHCCVPGHVFWLFKSSRNSLKWSGGGVYNFGVSESKKALVADPVPR